MLDIIVILCSSTQPETETENTDLFYQVLQMRLRLSRSADGLQWNLADLIISKDQQDFIKLIETLD